MAKKYVTYDKSGRISSVFFSEDIVFEEDLPIGDEGGGVIDLIEGTDIFNVSSLDIHSKYRVNLENKNIERIPE